MTTVLELATFRLSKKLHFVPTETLLCYATVLCPLFLMAVSRCLWKGTNRAKNMVCYTTRYFAASGFAKQEKERPRRIFCIKSYYKTREKRTMVFKSGRRKSGELLENASFSWYFKCETEEMMQEKKESKFQVVNKEALTTQSYPKLKTYWHLLLLDVSRAVSDIRYSEETDDVSALMK